MSPSAGGGGVGGFGRHFLIGLQKSSALTAHDRELLETLQPFGVVLFRDNFRHDLPYADWLSVLDELLADVAAVLDEERFLVAIDHEGGSVVRTPAPMTDFGAAATWRRQAAAVGRAMGCELRSLGVNLNFAPVADVDSNPDSPVIGRRAFGRDPEAVAKAAAAFLAGMQEEGVVGCLKHYPGHGDAAADSHHELPVVDADRHRLEARELVPYERLRSADVRMVMTAHVLFPALDPHWVATLSRRIVAQRLREGLDYDGVVVTDDVGMGAVAALFDRPEIPPRALAAGCDLIAICAHLTDTSRAIPMARALAAARDDGTLTEEIVVGSALRLDRLRESLSMSRPVALERETLEAHAKLARRIAEEAVSESGG